MFVVQYNVKMEAIANQGNVAETLRIMKQILKKLGCKFSRVGRGVSAMAGIMKIAMPEGNNSLPINTVGEWFITTILEHKDESFRRLG